MLESSFRELMKERDYAEITVADITESAGLNRATFYAHYEDKAHLAATTLRTELERAVLERISPPRAVSPDSLSLCAAATFEYVAGLKIGCPKAMDHLIAEMGQTLQETLERCLLNWFKHDPEAKKQFAGRDLELMANALAWSIYGGALRWSSLSTRPNSETSARALIGVFFKS